jgi:hypothetical protein
MIFRLAMLHPDGDLHAEYPPANPSIDDIHKISHFQYVSPGHAYAKDVLHSLVSVSKFWNSIARPLLYGNILITKYKSLRSLSRPLQTSAPLHCTPNELTSRDQYSHITGLSLVMDNSPEERSRAERTNLPLLQNEIHCLDIILNACHNLQYLRIVSFQHNLDPGISSGFGEDAMRCIRSIRWLEMDTVSSISRSLIAALRGSKPLEIWALQTNQRNDISESLQDISLPNLRALHIHSLNLSAVDWAASWELPALCTLTLDAYSLFPAQHHPAPILLETHGSTVTSLHLPGSSTILDAYLFSFFAKLHVLVVVANRIKQLPRIESLIRLDIRLLGDDIYIESIISWINQQSTRDIRDFVKSLRQRGLGAHFPSLTCIRIVDIPSRATVSGYDPMAKDEGLWRECVQMCKEMCIRFEDSSGTAFVYA